MQFSFLRIFKNITKESLKATFTDPRTYMHIVGGALLMQVLKYFCWLAYEDNATWMIWGAMADLHKEADFGSGLVMFSMAIALSALFIEWLETKVSEGTDISIADILVTVLGGAIAYPIVFLYNTESLPLTLISGIGLAVGAVYLFGSVIFKKK